MLVVDRFEEDILVCVDESETLVLLNRADVLQKAKEGDVLVQSGEGYYSVDAAATSARKNAMRKRLDRLFEQSE